jgi:hypothetical protein
VVSYLKADLKDVSWPAPTSASVFFPAAIIIPPVIFSIFSLIVFAVAKWVSAGFAHSSPAIEKG